MIGMAMPKAMAELLLPDVQSKELVAFNAVRPIDSTGWAHLQTYKN